MPPARCVMEKDQITFLIELTEGTLKHFYPDYKDYFYLPFDCLLYTSDAADE